MCLYQASNIHPDLFRFLLEESHILLLLLNDITILSPSNEITIPSLSFFYTTTTKIFKTTNKKNRQKNFCRIFCCLFWNINQARERARVRNTLSFTRMLQ